MKVSRPASFVVMMILTLFLVACGGAAASDDVEGQPAPATQTAPTPTAVEALPQSTSTAVPEEPTAAPTPTEPLVESEPTDESEPPAESQPDTDTEESDPAQEEQTMSGDADAGAQHFQQVCSACHGENATGIEGLGKDLTTSAFVAGLDDAELLEFIQQGRPVDHPDNTTGVAMPPRGGNPDFSDDQLLDIIAFIRTLQEQ